MASSRIPGPTGVSNSVPFDVGTLVRSWSAAPGPVCAIPPAPPPRAWHHFSRTGGFMASTLTMSPEAVSLLQAIETLRLKPYDDQTGKATTEWVVGATVGYGHLIAKTEWTDYKDGITAQRADDLFRSDVSPYEVTVGETISADVQQYEFDAMVILAFNIGRHGFRDSSVAKLINNPKAVTKYLSLEIAWKAFDKSQGKENAGLVNRRSAEWKIYTSGIYARW